jgi:RNA polymerase sigma-70 factor (ECF subfamily)
VTLETLSPLERAAFLLHDVFDMDFSEIAGVLERSEPAVRQLAVRARSHVRDGRPRFTPSPAAGRLAEAFQGAVLRGELPALARLLAEDAVVYSDGGGKRKAALHPIFGRAKILRFFLGIARKRGAPLESSEMQPVLINGMPGFLMRSEDGVETLALEIVGEQITAIYAVRNPDKLRHLS